VHSSLLTSFMLFSSLTFVTYREGRSSWFSVVVCAFDFLDNKIRVGVVAPKATASNASYDLSHYATASQ